MPPVVQIFGPTASGKSALAMEVAKRLDGIVLAVDSMTVYRGMDIGTAKPSAEERASVPHEGLDLVDPTEAFTVRQWLDVADRVLAETDQPVIAVGGTPLYHQALVRGLFDGPAGDEAIRRELDPLSDDEVHAKLAEVDPVSAGRLHPHNRRRVVRALEVHRLTGRPISELQRQWEEGPDRVETVRFGMAWPREELNRRINARTKQMIADGWPAEVEALLDRHGHLGPTAREAAGYRLLSLVAQDRMSLADAAEQIKIKTRQLAKRQMTWFRRFQQTLWLDGAASAAEQADKVGELLANAENRA
ncbi:MAG: tRNA (adenosine(37)-N6)-dimethylallyltransferase MiaA [Planctomycetota bacterium]